MSAVLLAIVVTSGVGHDHSSDHIAWWKRHLKCRTLVRYGECGKCDSNGPCDTCEGGFNYRVQFDYLWYLNRRKPNYSPVMNASHPGVAPVEETLSEESLPVLSVPEEIIPPMPARGLFD